MFSSGKHQEAALVHLYIENRIGNGKAIRRKACTNPDKNSERADDRKGPAMRPGLENC